MKTPARECLHTDANSASKGFASRRHPRPDALTRRRYRRGHDSDFKLLVPELQAGIQSSHGGAQTAGRGLPGSSQNRGAPMHPSHANGRGPCPRPPPRHPSPAPEPRDAGKGSAEEQRPREAACLTCCKYIKVKAHESWGHMPTLGSATQVAPVRGCCISALWRPPSEPGDARMQSRRSLPGRYNFFFSF